MEKPELLLRTDVFEEYEEHSRQISVDTVIKLLEEGWPGVWWNAYAMSYDFMVKPFPYPARNGYFVDIETRMATHRFESKGIVRRDTILKEDGYLQIVPPAYRNKWHDVKDAIRCYSIIISRVEKLDEPIPVENFGLFNSWGRVSKTDRLQRPRLIKPITPV